MGNMSQMYYDVREEVCLDGVGCEEMDQMQEVIKEQGEVSEIKRELQTYLEIYLDTLTDEEKSLVFGRVCDVEEELCVQVGLLSVRERRLLQEMGRAREEGREIPQLMKLEDSLSSVQSKKTRSLLALSDVRGKKAKMLFSQEVEEKGNNVDLSGLSDESLEVLREMLTTEESSFD